MKFQGMEITNSSELTPGDHCRLVKAGARTINHRDGTKSEVQLLEAKTGRRGPKEEFVANVRVFKDRKERKRVEELLQ